MAEHVRAQPATVELATGQQKIGTESCRDLRQRRCARHHHITRNLIGIEYGDAECLEARLHQRFAAGDAAGQSDRQARWGARRVGKECGSTCRSWWLPEP